MLSQKTDKRSGIISGGITVPDAAWKAFERTIATFFGGKRRGAYTGSNGSGKSDIIKPGWSIECKLLSKIGWQDCLNAVSQAEKNAEPGDIPVAVIKRKGDRLTDCLVVMRLSEYGNCFVGNENPFVEIEE